MGSTCATARCIPRGRDRVKDIVNELMSTSTVHHPASSRLFEARRAAVDAWIKTAAQLDAQGETILSPVKSGTSLNTRPRC